MKTQITMVQFSSVHDHKYWEPDLFKMYFVGETNTREEFEETFEGDDGDEVTDTVVKRCISIYATYHDYLQGEESAYIPKDDSEYVITRIKVMVNENHEILGLANNLEQEEDL